MYFLIGMNDKTRHLGVAVLDCGKVGEEGEFFGLGISVLPGQFCCIDGGNVDARGSAGFHPRRPNAPFGQLSRQSVRGKFADASPLKRIHPDEKFADASAFEILLSDEKSSRKKGSGG